VTSAARVAAISNHSVISDRSSYLSVNFCIITQGAPTIPADNFLSLRCQKLTTVNMQLEDEKTKRPLKLYAKNVQSRRRQFKSQVFRRVD
jgi:hypothetical protein